MRTKFSLFILSLLVMVLVSCNSQDKGNQPEPIDIRVEDGIYYSQFAQFNETELAKFDVERTTEDDIKTLLQDIDTAILNVSDYLDCPNWKDQYTGKNGVGDDFYIDIILTSGTSRVHNPPLKILFNDKWYNKNRLPITHEITHALNPNQTSRSLREGLAELMQSKFNPKNSLFLGDAPVHQVVKVYFETIDINDYQLMLKSIGNKMAKIDISSRKDFKKRAMFYNLSHSFVKYLIDEYGITKFMSLYHAKDLEAGYQEIYNKDYQMLIDEWLNFIKNNDFK